MSKWIVKLRCRDCGNKYKRTMTAADEAELANVPDPPCPRCNAPAPVYAADDWAAHGAPAIGGKPITKAMDLTQEIIAQDHGVTNMGDHFRQGDVLAPKIAPHLQAQADGMFGGGNNSSIRGMTKRPLKIAGMNANSEALRRAVIGGAFSAGGAAEASAAIAGQHAKRFFPETKIVNEGQK